VVVTVRVAALTFAGPGLLPCGLLASRLAHVRQVKGVHTGDDRLARVDRRRSRRGGTLAGDSGLCLLTCEHCSGRGTQFLKNARRRRQRCEAQAKTKAGVRVSREGSEIRIGHLAKSTSKRNGSGS
jgi:hypothetical protein